MYQDNIFFIIIISLLIIPLQFSHILKFPENNFSTIFFLFCIFLHYFHFILPHIILATVNSFLFLFFNLNIWQTVEYFFLQQKWYILVSVKSRAHALAVFSVTFKTLNEQHGFHSIQVATLFFIRFEIKIHNSMFFGLIE